MTVGRIHVDSEFLGVGFTIAAKLGEPTKVALTANHVIEGRSSKNREHKSLTFTTKMGQEVSVERVESDDHLDVAVLHLKDAVAEGLAVDRAVERDEWRTEAQILPDDPILTGTIEDTDHQILWDEQGNGVSVIQLKENHSLREYQGYSGAPVQLPSDAVIGVLFREVRSRFSNNTLGPSEASNVLYAIPIQEVLKRFGLDAAWGPETPIKDDLKFSEISPLPDTGSYFVGREERLKQLDEAWNNPDINIVSLVASGGVGKSALINEWLSRLGEHYGGADRVFIWSFYDQGVSDRIVSADSFIEEALNFFGEANPNQGTQLRKGQRLADRIQERRKPLLIIDGLEPFQHSPGPNAGKLKDASLRELLVGLANLNYGLCVISTRLAITDLTRFEGKSSLYIDLENLSAQAGAELLRSRGIKGSQEELEIASMDYEGHALALTLLASYLGLVFHGDIHQRENVSLLAMDKEQGGHWQGVMRACERWFEEEAEEVGRACLAVWRLFGLFERSVDEDFLRVEFLGADPIRGLTDTLADLRLDEQLFEWRKIIRRLTSADLLSKKPDNNLDAHPLIREHFREQLKRSKYEAWREGNERLSRLYVKRYLDAAKEQPTIKEMEPLFQATIHACKADRHHEALHQIYLSNIMRGEDEAYAESKLGALGALLSVLSHFFREGSWGKPVQSLSERDQLVVLTDAGRYLTATKGYAAPEVGACYETAKTLSDEKEDPRRFFEARLGMSRFLRVGGQLIKTDEENQRILKAYNGLDHRTRDILRPTVYSAVQRALATNYYYMGDFCKAEDYAREGATILEQVPVKMRPEERKQALKRARLDVNEPSILCLSYQAAASWFLGEPDKALRTSADAVNRAVDLDHAHTLAIALLLDGMVKHFCGDPTATKATAERLFKHCGTHGFPLWQISGEILEAWASARLEQDEQIELDDLIENRISSWEQDFTAKLITPYWYALLTETCLMKGKFEKGLKSVEKGLKCSGEEHWWDAELYRLEGELMLLQPHKDPMGAKECFKKALSIAEDQKAKSLELRTAVRLARIDGTEDARSSLEQIYGSFRKNFETEDLEEAKQLLDNPQ